MRKIRGVTMEIQEEEEAEARVRAFGAKWNDEVTDEDIRGEDEKKIDAKILRCQQKNFQMGMRMVDNPQWPFNRREYTQRFWFNFLVFVSQNPGFSPGQKCIMFSLIRRRFHAFASVNRWNELLKRLEDAILRERLERIPGILDGVHELSKFYLDSF